MRVPIIAMYGSAIYSEASVRRSRRMNTMNELENAGSHTLSRLRLLTQSEGSKTEGSPIRI